MPITDANYKFILGLCITFTNKNEDEPSDTLIKNSFVYLDSTP